MSQDTLSAKLLSQEEWDEFKAQPEKIIARAEARLFELITQIETMKAEGNMERINQEQMMNQLEQNFILVQRQYENSQEQILKAKSESEALQKKLDEAHQELQAAKHRTFELETATQQASRSNDEFRDEKRDFLQMLE